MDYEELGRYRGTDGDRYCIICGNDCEKLVHCPMYANLNTLYTSK